MQCQALSEGGSVRARRATGPAGRRWAAVPVLLPFIYSLVYSCYSACSRGMLGMLILLMPRNGTSIAFSRSECVFIGGHAGNRNLSLRNFSGTTTVMTSLVYKDR